MITDGRYSRQTAAPHLPTSIRISAGGFATVLGDLENRIMNLAWELREPATARVIHGKVFRHHPVTIHTVITVLNKLVVKKLLYREKQDSLFHYYPRISEDDYRKQVSRYLVEGMLSLGPDAISGSLVDVLAERDPERLADLAELVRRRVGEVERRSRRVG